MIVRQRDGDSGFFYPLAEAVPDRVTGQTAHDSKGTEAEHVIIPKVMSSGGYLSIRTDQWVRPIKQPPAIYEEKGPDYQLEEERRMFYVALTGAERRVDLLTVDGAESRFLDELPAATCSHVRPFSEDERDQLATRELRKNMRGQVVSTQTNGQFVHFDWVEGGILDVNLYDATADQISQLESLATADRDVLLQNCGLEYRPSPTDDRGETERVQLQVDGQTSIEPVD